MTTVQTVCGLELLAARAVLVETLGCVPFTRACVPKMTTSVLAESVLTN